MFMSYGFDIFDIFNDGFSEESTTDNTLHSKDSTNVSADESLTNNSLHENNNFNIEAEDDGDELSISDAEEKKVSKTKKKSAAKTSKNDIIKGVVQVIGNGWQTTYGEAEHEYEAKDVAQALYNSGYKEIAVAELKSSKNTLYVNVVNQKASADDVQMGDVITIELGNFKVIYHSTDFPGLTEPEISLFDVVMKFQQNNPQFVGCGLKFDSGSKVASPVFSKKASIKADESYPVWTESGIQQMLGADIKDDNVYVSDTGTYFVVSNIPKNAATVYSHSLTLAKGDKEKKAVEVYRLPFTLWIENFGTNKDCTKDDFGGKESVTKDEIIRYLSNEYRFFRSQSRKYSISYDRNAAIVGVAGISGEKGVTASVTALPTNIVDFFDCKKRLSSVKERVEKTALGLFRGYEDEHDMLSLELFDMSLPKIPSYLLDTIVMRFKSNLMMEDMIQIYYSIKSKSYYLVHPEVVCDKISVRYQMTHSKDILVMSIHSHNTMPAIFSEIDDEDEVYTGLFGVIGDLDKKTISMSFRAGMEGKFKSLYYADIFSDGGDIA